MLEFCLLALVCLVLVCGAFVEQVEEQTLQELDTFFAGFNVEA